MAYMHDHVTAQLLALHGDLVTKCGVATIGWAVAVARLTG